jgi:membrane protein DedA with SNARE-associated domain
MRKGARPRDGVSAIALLAVAAIVMVAGDRIAAAIGRRLGGRRSGR